MKILLIVLSSFVTLGGLVLIVAQPIAGILFALFGIALLIYGIKYKKPDPVTVSSESYEQAIEEHHEHTIMVAGYDYHQPELKSLLTEPNPLYDVSKSEWLNMFSDDDRIYEYEKARYPLHLEAEPDNPHDINAVKVFADNVFIGYVPHGMFPEVSEYASIENVKVCVEIFGGKYKYLDYDSEEDYLGTLDDKYYKLKTETSPVKAIMVFEW